MSQLVTIFKNITSSATGFNRSVDFCLDRIRNGNSKELLNRIRLEPEKDARNKLKMGLPSICFSGTFSNRSAAGLIQHSSLICLDFDGFKDSEEMQAYRDTIQAWEYTFALFTSPSGDGLKVLVRIPPDAENHKGYFDSLAEKWDCEQFDKGTSDVSRVCYESYDPNLYHNPDALVWMTIAEPDEDGVGGHCDQVMIPVASENQIIERLQKWWSMKYGSTKGSRNNNLYRFANALNSFGISQSEADRYLKQFAEKDFKTDEIERLVKSAYKHRDRFHTRFFEDKAAQAKIEKLVRSGKKDSEIVLAMPELANCIETALSDVKETMTVTDFWTYNEKGKILLSPHKYKYFLEQNQFFKFFPEGSNSFVFVQIESNLLSDTASARIKDFILDNLRARTDIGYLPYDFMANQTRLFKDDYLSLLATADVTLKSDNETTCYLYYKNCAVEVSPNNVRQIDYIDLDGFVWRKHVINRDYTGANDCDGMFKQFLWLVSGKDELRFNALRSVIGYLLHSYKTSAKNKAIILNDEAISDNPNGGSGKGMFCAAIGHMKRVNVLDGKQFSFEKSFPYQTVGADSQVLVFDDVKKNFAFEQLFSLITEGITLEKKNKDAIYIPVSRSPKIVITTNYTIGGVGGSFERRKFEVEMSAYFGAHHSPYDEFGCMLFDEWDAAEWARFDAFMIECCQFYLSNGLVAHAGNNLEFRKFIKETASEFAEWANTETLPCNQRLDKGAMFEHFVTEYGDFKKWLTQKKFTGWMEAYGKREGYKVTQGKSGSLRWILFEGESEVIEGDPF
jgi:hypothetical protein